MIVVYFFIKVRVHKCVSATSKAAEAGELSHALWALANAAIPCPYSWSKDAFDFQETKRVSSLYLWQGSFII